jgi:hypothetical protein
MAVMSLYEYTRILCLGEETVHLFGGPTDLTVNFPHVLVYLTSIYQLHWLYTCVHRELPSNRCVAQAEELDVSPPGRPRLAHST